MDNIYKNILLLDNWVKKENYTGYDPYDALNSELVNKLCGNSLILKIMAIQINKFLPINIRTHLRILKNVDLKGIALFANSYSKLYALTNNEIYKKNMVKCLKYIEQKNLIKKYGYNCWSSHYFPYISLDKINYHNKIPDVIGTSQVIISLIEIYKILQAKYLFELALDSCYYIIDNLLDIYKENYFIKYSKNDSDKIVFNASAQALEAFSKILDIQNKKKISNISSYIKETLTKFQKNDGSWYYSMYKNRKIRIQLDFHQGYIIDGLFAYLPHSNDYNYLLQCIKKGLIFYKTMLFKKNGISYYRYPYQYPIDIHNQAQGIITFSKVGSIQKSYICFAQKTAIWTINNMQSNEGYFYYQKWPSFTNKIPYMRWGQAWMMLALATFLSSGEY